MSVNISSKTTELNPVREKAGSSPGVFTPKNSGQKGEKISWRTKKLFELQDKYESDYCHIRYKFHPTSGSHIITLHLGESLDITIDSLYPEEAYDVAKFLLRKLCKKEVIE